MLEQPRGKQEKHSNQDAYYQELTNAPSAVSGGRIYQFSHKPGDSDSHQSRQECTDNRKDKKDMVVPMELRFQFHI